MNFHLAFALSTTLCIAKQNLSKGVNVVCEGSPSLILIVLRISFGITTLPRSSILRTIPVAFIYIYLLILQIMMLVSVKEGEIYFLKLKRLKKSGVNHSALFVLPVFKEPKKVLNKLLRQVPYQEDRGFWGRSRKVPFWKSFRWRWFPLRPVL